MNLKIYKKGQGSYTRLTTAGVVLLLSAWGCWKLYLNLKAMDIVNANVKMWVQSITPLAVFGVIAVIVFWLVNKVLIADFMISAEGEVKKVNWSSRQELMVSTYIVVIVVILTAFFLGMTDIIFQILFRAIGLLPSVTA